MINLTPQKEQPVPMSQDNVPAETQGSRNGAII
jgi:hypothetical protein